MKKNIIGYSHIQTKNKQKIRHGLEFRRMYNLIRKEGKVFVDGFLKDLSDKFITDGKIDHMKLSEHKYFSIKNLLTVYNILRSDNTNNLISININYSKRYIEICAPDELLNDYISKEIYDIIFKYIKYRYSYRETLKKHYEKDLIILYKKIIYSPSYNNIVDKYYDIDDIIYKNFKTRLELEFYNFVRINIFKEKKFSPIFIRNKIDEALLIFNHPMEFYIMFMDYIVSQVTNQDV